MPHEDPTLAEALRACQHDMTAFEPIYEAFVDRIYTYCLHRVGSTTDAEDITSQVFARAMDKCHTFRGGHVGAWLFRIAYHLTVDYYRKKRPTSLTPTQLSVLTSPEQSPLEVVMQQERKHYLENLLAQLDDDKRNLLLLSITGNLTAVEVGKVVGKRANTVRVELHRIIQQLRRIAILNAPLKSDTLDKETS
ncbi:MAG: sigma-70 family RNA polymerase sigma factor [Chloroflexota bacterium]